MTSNFFEYLSNPSNQITVNALMFLVGTLFGLIASRLTMTKAERKSYQQTIYDNGLNLSRELEQKYKVFCDTLQAYASKRGKITLEDFRLVSTAGDMYFGELKVICEAILTGKIDADSRDRNFVPRVTEALQKNIFLYYDTLKDIAIKCKTTYVGEFSPKNYQGIIEVVEKYAPTEFKVYSTDVAARFD